MKVTIQALQRYRCSGHGPFGAVLLNHPLVMEEPEHAHHCHSGSQQHRVEQEEAAGQRKSHHAIVPQRRVTNTTIITAVHFTG